MQNKLVIFGVYITLYTYKQLLKLTELCILPHIDNISKKK